MTENITSTPLLIRRHERKRKRNSGSAIVGTGRSLFELVLPDEPITALISSSVNSWAVMTVNAFEVKQDGPPLASFGRSGSCPPTDNHWSRRCRFPRFRRHGKHSIPATFHLIPLSHPRGPYDCKSSLRISTFESICKQAQYNP